MAKYNKNWPTSSFEVTKITLTNININVNSKIAGLVVKISRILVTKIIMLLHTATDSLDYSRGQFKVAC